MYKILIPAFLLVVVGCGKKDDIEITEPSPCSVSETAQGTLISCPDGTSALVSNGTVGDEGPQGPAGPSGPSGSRGPAGPSGPAGPTGPSGSDGAPGQDGNHGQDGQDGAPGQDGNHGRDGQDGHDGQDGNHGRDGQGWVPTDHYRCAGEYTYNGGKWVVTLDIIVYETLDLLFALKEENIYNGRVQVLRRNGMQWPFILGDTDIRLSGSEFSVEIEKVGEAAFRFIRHGGSTYSNNSCAKVEDL